MVRFLFLLQLFHFSLGIELSGISVIQHDVPFAYLVTRTPIYTSRPGTSFNIDNVIVKNCGTKMCFAALYDKGTKFQLISDVQNNCTTNPHCLSFTEASYDYSIVFMNTSETGCSLNPSEFLKNKFKMPKCASGWYSWTRPNGRLWCYMISKVPHAPSQTWNTTNSFCRKSYNASLNGFQTIEERSVFIKRMQSLDISIGWMYIGATRPCNTKSCPKSVQVRWQNGVSTNHAIANDNFYIPYWDASGNCMAIMHRNGQYDDISCSQQTAFTCGKWADIYA